MSYCDMPPSFFRETKQRARKEHKCCECGAKIYKGEVYWRSTGKWDDVQTYPQHTWCRAACTQLSSFDDDGCIPFTYMFEAWSEVCPGYRKEPEYKKLRKYLAKAIWQRHIRWRAETSRG